jgi:hypothetical protein
MLYGIILKDESVSKDGDAKLSFTVSTVDDANAALAAADNVEVTLTYLGMDGGSIEVPAVETRAGSSKSITIEKIENYTNPIFNDKSGESATSVENLTIALPTHEDGVVSINMKNSTVTLNSTSEETYLPSVVTTDNTFIVGKGVTIRELEVKAGNVTIKNEGKIGEIISSNGQAVYVTVEDGGTVSIYGDKVYDVSNITTYDVLNDALAYEGELSLKLGSDVELTHGIYVQGKKTLDLNGHTIKPTANETDFTSSCMLCVASTATLTINDSVGGGTITANGNDVVRNVIAVDSGGTLIENYNK